VRLMSVRFFALRLLRGRRMRAGRTGQRRGQETGYGQVAEITVSTTHHPH
jgi:hypothetical protein